MLYCIEQADQTVPVSSVRLDPRTAWTEAAGPTTLGTHTVLTAKGYSVSTADDALYAPWRHDASQPVRLTLIPYHLWANRAAGAMTVWIPIA